MKKTESKKVDWNKDLKTVGVIGGGFLAGKAAINVVKSALQNQSINSKLRGTLGATATDGIQTYVPEIGVGLASLYFYSQNKKNGNVGLIAMGAAGAAASSIAAKLASKAGITTFNGLGEVGEVAQLPSNNMMALPVANSVTELASDAEYVTEEEDSELDSIIAAMQGIQGLGSVADEQLEEIVAAYDNDDAETFVNGIYGLAEVVGEEDENMQYLLGLAEAVADVEGMEPESDEDEDEGVEFEGIELL